MKILSRKSCRLLVFLLGITDLLAKGGGNNPPSPTGKKTGTPPPGLDINEGIWILIIVALVLGSYVIYKYKLKIKPSV